MLEGIAELFVFILDIIFFSSSSKKKRYHKTNKTVNIWADKIDINKNDITRDNKSHTVNLQDDAGNNFTIKIERLRFNRFKISASDGHIGKKQRTWKKKIKSSNLMKVLFESYGVIEQWISKSGSKRTT